MSSVEIEFALRVLALAIEGISRVADAVGTSDEDKAKLTQLAADAEARRASLESQWKDLAPKA